MILTLLAWLLVANMNSQGVLAVTIDFQWLGNQGYTAKGSFSYDEKTAPTIFSEKGSGKMQVLEDVYWEEIEKAVCIELGFSKSLSP